MATQAEDFKAKMLKYILGHKNVNAVNVDAGIMKVNFLDGSYVDFTEPMVGIEGQLSLLHPSWR